MKNLSSNLSLTAGAIVLGLIAAGMSACTYPSSTRMGMVTDEETGLMFGSAIEKNLITDASFYSNRKIKVRTRNTSGDEVFNLERFTGDLNTAYTAKGYEPTGQDDFGLMMDINVMYSGQVQTNRASSYRLIGALMGATYGGETDRGLLTGTVTGAALGNVAGHFDTQDTYMIVAQVTFGVLKPYKETRKRITFSRSNKLKTIDNPNEDEKIINRGFKKTVSTQIAIYAGGRNLGQSEIAEEVRKRAVRIVADFI